MAGNPITYRDFSIEMTNWKDDGTFTVRVIGKTPTGGEMRADEAEQATYRPGEFNRLLGLLESRNANQSQLIELGEKLAALLLPGRVRAFYEKSLDALKEDEGLRLRLRIDPLKLAALPWEYTYVKRTFGEKVSSDFLSLQRRVSITRYETIGAPLQPLTGKEKFRVVIALANPMIENPEDFPNQSLPSLDLDADRRAILSAIGGLKTRTQAVEPIVLQPATREHLLKSIANADIFHFAGHGVFEGSELTSEGTLRKKGKILLQTEEATEDRFDSDQLAVILSNAGVRLAVLGACNSATRDAGGAWTGVAPALVRENIPAVVAMQYKVRDRNASYFMAFLYARVLAGSTIDEAVFEGRQAIFTQNGLEDRDWGVPVLYLRAEDGFLFPLPPQNQEAPAREDPLVIVQRQIGTIRGSDIGADIDDIFEGRVEVRDSIYVIEEGAKTIGVKIKRMGGSPSPDPKTRHPLKEEE
jgi:CHAT domain